jgi:hypothetical protein
LFFRNFDVGSIELPITVRLECAKNIPYDLFLPIDKLKLFSCPRAFGMAQAFNKINGIIGSRLVVGRVLCLELCRGIFL